MTVAEQRVWVQREPRQKLDRLPAWIMSGDDEAMTKSACVILDVSTGGAKIETDATINIRDRFALEPLPGFKKLRDCEVVWRLGKTFGLKFLH
jgi:hypothetical protein